MRGCIWFWIAVVLATPLARADEDRELAKRARSAIARFKREYRSKDTDRRCNALLELSRTQHPTVVAEMGKVLLKDRDAEVRDACAIVLGEMTDVPEEAGEAIRDVLDLCVAKRRDEDPEVLKSMAKSIGSLRYQGAHDQLLWLLDHKDQWVVVATLVAIGEVGDLKALPKIYDMAAYQGTGYSWSTGEVVVDTGAAGDADQKAAEAAWKAKYGHIRPKKAGPTVVKLYMRHLRETVEKLTGEKFASLAAFKAWINEHEVEVGLKPPPKKGRRGK
jgi:hypothetical protein